MHHKLFFCLSLLLLILTSSCKKKEGNTTTKEQAVQTNQTYDYDEILEAGQMIVVTLSSPSTYFDYNGQPMGEQYALIDNFAQNRGIGVRVELAHNSGEMLKMLREGHADMAIYQLTEATITANGLTAAGMHEENGKTSWAVAPMKPKLCEELNAWYNKELCDSIMLAEKKRIEQPVTVRRTVRPAFISRGKGEFSVYDALFKSAAQKTGLDWRLIASICYVESGFDPNAVSSAGARGLMQLMPQTAQKYNVTNPNDPAQSILGGSQALRDLLHSFRGISNPSERIKFALAAYNGGIGHIQDAMALTKKHGANNNWWNNVRPYLLHLSQPEYYTDSAVRFGYMRGTETISYVDKVLAQYLAYGGSISFTSPSTSTIDKTESYRSNNRYTHGTRVISASDSMFQDVGE